MERTQTIAYLTSRILVRSIGPSKIADKKAKEILLTILWSDCWRDTEGFPSELNLARNPF